MKKLLINIYTVASFKHIFFVLSSEGFTVNEPLKSSMILSFFVVFFYCLHSINICCHVGVFGADMHCW